jgi:hypothetical protein
LGPLTAPEHWDSEDRDLELDRGPCKPVVFQNENMC